MIPTLFGIMLNLFVVTNGPVVWPVSPVLRLAQHEFAMSKRYDDQWVSNVFKENILLTLAYMRGIVQRGEAVDWAKVDEPFTWNLDLVPGQVISYHDTLLPNYQGRTTPLTTVHFNSAEGFLSDGYLVGDGTCHLASLMAWVARDAALAVEAPTNHNFAHINEVPKEEGVSIYNHPQRVGSSAAQNLYIQNNKDHPVQFTFSFDGEILRLSVSELL